MKPACKGKGKKKSVLSILQRNHVLETKQKSPKAELSEPQHEHLVNIRSRAVGPHCGTVRAPHRCAARHNHVTVHRTLHKPHGPDQGSTL